MERSRLRTSLWTLALAGALAAAVLPVIRLLSAAPPQYRETHIVSDGAGWPLSWIVRFPLDAETYLKFPGVDEWAKHGLIALAGDVAIHPLIFVVDMTLLALAAGAAAELLYWLATRSRYR